jgi:hypothetical protein
VVYSQAPQSRDSHSQNVALEGGILIFLRLRDVLLTMANSISICMCPSLVAVGFGLCVEFGRAGWLLSHGCVKVALAGSAVDCTPPGNDREQMEAGKRVAREGSMPAAERAGAGSLCMEIVATVCARPSSVWLDPPRWNTSNGIVRQVRAALTRRSRDLGERVVSWVSKSGADEVSVG